MQCLRQLYVELPRGGQKCGCYQLRATVLVAADKEVITIDLYNKDYSVRFKNQ